MRWRASSGEQMKFTDANFASSADSGRSARSIEPAYDTGLFESLFGSSLAKAER